MAQGKELLNIALLNAALDMSEGRGLGESIGRTAQGLNLVSQFEQQQTGTQLDNAKKMLELKKLEQEVSKAGEELDVPEKAYTKEQQALDATIPEAFGIVDVVERQFTSGLGLFNIGPAEGYEANIAKQAADDLNQNIKIVLTEGYKGKPSNFLLKSIEELLPSGFMGDPNATAKYRVLRQQFISREKALSEEIKLAKPNSKTLIDLVQQRANVVQVKKRLDNVLNSFMGKTPLKSDPLSFYAAPGLEAGVVIEDDEQSLKAMTDEFLAANGDFD